MRKRKSKYPKASDRVRCRYIPEWGVAIAYSPLFRDTVVLNQLSYLIWRLCDGTRTQKELKSKLEKLFTGPQSSSARIAHELNNALDRMRETYLVE